MFGYATVLRSNTQGKAEFTICRYGAVPTAVREDLIKAHLEEKPTNCVTR